MNIKELLAAIALLSVEEKNQVFSSLGNTMETLPKELEAKFLAKKNAKLTERETRIAELESQVDGFEAKNKDRVAKAQTEFIASQGRANKVVSALTKDFARAAKEALNENSKLGEKALDKEAVIKTLLTENKHYTNASVSNAGVVIVEEEKDKAKFVPHSAKDLLRQAQNRNK